VYELDLDSIGIDEVENRPVAAGHLSDLRSRNPTSIKPSRPLLQFLQRRGLEREMIQTSMS